MLHILLHNTFWTYCTIHLREQLCTVFQLNTAGINSTTVENIGSAPVGNERLTTGEQKITVSLTTLNCLCWIRCRKMSLWTTRYSTTQSELSKTRSVKIAGLKTNEAWNCQFLCAFLAVEAIKSSFPLHYFLSVAINIYSSNYSRT